MGKITNDAEKVMPYLEGKGKREQVETMFDSIAPAYDLMNRLMSLGMHTRWRNYALRQARQRLGYAPEKILDVATGTGDLVFPLHRRFPKAQITGIDLSEGMLEIARCKLAAYPSQNKDLIIFLQGDCLNLPFEDNSFDLLTVAYGVRNFADTLRGYREMLRVLKPGGVLCVVELCQPTAALPLAAYRLYTRGIIPLAGRLISGDPRAYSYLHESIEAVPQRRRMALLMKEAGFKRCAWKTLSPGVVGIYIGSKL